MNDAAINICMQVLVWLYISISLGFISRSRIAESYTNSVFNCLRTARLFPKAAAPFYSPISRAWGLQFFHILTSASLTLIIAILVLVKWFLIVVLICVPLLANEAENFFMYLLAIFSFSLKKYLVRSSAHFLIGLFVFLLLNCKALYIF